MKIKEARKVLWMNAVKTQVSYNEESMQKAAKKFANVYEKYHDWYCPSQKERSEKTICPCAHYMSTGVCICGLYEDQK